MQLMHIAVYNSAVEKYWDYERPANEVEEFIMRQRELGTWGQDERWVYLDFASKDEIENAIGSKEELYGNRIVRQIFVRPDFKITIEPLRGK